AMCSTRPGLTRWIDAGGTILAHVFGSGAAEERGSMSALRAAHAAFIAAAFITGCYQSHGVEECADGPYGFSRCLFHGELSVEQERALCAWEASIFEPAPDVVTCPGFNVRYRDFDACLAEERFVMDDCEQPVGVW